MFFLKLYFKKYLYIAIFMVLSLGIFLFISPTKILASYTCTGGGDHAGANWDPATDCPSGIAGTHTNISTLTVGTGETATVQAWNGTSFGSVNISAATGNIVGTI